jgi:hypothetical protein
MSQLRKEIESICSEREELLVFKQITQQKESIVQTTQQFPS